MVIVVAGGGMAGLSAALALARAGHDVSVIERDAVNTAGGSQGAFEWTRNGCTQFQQPHAFLARGRLVLSRQFPDVYDALLRAGALAIEPDPSLLGERQPGDDEIVCLAVRRPLIEWALRDAVLKEPRIRTIANTKIVGLAGKSGPVPRIEGIRTTEGEIAGEVVVDALGRTSPVQSWIEAMAGTQPVIESSPCGLFYYSRYFKVRPGAEVPRGPWVLGTRGDTGYLMYAAFVGDNRTVGLSIGPPAWDTDLRILQHEAAFMAACREIPAFRQLLDDTILEPVTPVLAMGSIENTIRNYAPDGRLCAIGLFPLADSVCHTDPSVGLGLSFALIHATELVRTLAEIPSDAAAQTRSYLARIEPEIRERFVQIRDFDDARNRLWKGEKPGDRFLMSVAAAVLALRDPEIYRKIIRRACFLDRTSVFDDDAKLQERVQTALAQMSKAGPPPKTGPDRDALLAGMRAQMGIEN